MRHILILGANGFIGSHLARYLSRDKDIKLSLFSRRFSGPVMQMASESKVELFQGDFRDPAPLHKALEGQEVVYHLISESFPANSWSTPVLDVEKNLIPTLRFIEAAEKAGVKKIAFASSGGTVYGKANGILDETERLHPFSPHGIIKLCIENFLNYSYVKSGLCFDVYRVANPYGPDQNREGLGVISTWLHQILEDQEILIYGDGHIVRDFIYIEDTIRLLSLSATKAMDHCDTYNVSTGTGVSLNDLLDELKNTIARPFRFRYVPARKVDNDLVILNNAKIMRSFPGLKLHSLKEGLQKTWNSLKP